MLDALPLSPNGKVDRNALPALDQCRVGRNGVRGAFDNVEEARMASLWEEVLETQPVGPEDNFFDLGGDSLQAIRLLNRIATVFGCDLPLASLVQAPTVVGLVRMLGTPRRLGVASLVHLRGAGTGPRFFCVPGAGGDVLHLAELADHLGSAWSVYGIQGHPPGGPEPLPGSLEELAARYTALIQAAQPAGPYFLGGFSFGGTMAFAVARQLVAQGQTVAALVVLDQCACSSVPGRALAPVWSEVLKNFPGWVRHELPRLSPSHLLNWLGHRVVGLAQWFRRGATAAPPAADSSTLLYDYQIRLQRDYVPGPYEGRVTLLRAASQKAQLLFDALLSGWDFGWGRLARGGVSVMVVPGWHLSMLKKPDVLVLAACLRRCLDQAHAATPGSSTVRDQASGGR